MTKLAANVGKQGAVKNKMPFISQCLGLAQSAAAQMPGDCWPSRLPCSTGKAWDPIQTCNSSCSLEIGSETSSMAKSSTARGAEHMQTMCKAWPFWRELFLGTHADYPRPCRADRPCLTGNQGRAGQLCQKRKWQGHAETAVLLDNATSPVAI